MSNIDLFPTRIHKNFYSGAENLKESLFSKLDEVFENSEKNNNAFMRGGTVCSYHTSADLHVRYPAETQAVVDFVESCAREYWISCGYHTDLEPFVFQLWANKTPKGGYIDSHLHGNMPFTGVLYVDACPEQGNLMIENPLETILMTQPIGPDIKYPISKELAVNTGDLIMFPGYLRHSVKSNTLETARLILGFNIGCRGSYWSSHRTHHV